MKINHILISSIVALAISTFISCTKTEVDAIGANDKNNLTLEFDNRVGDQKLVLGSTSFKNSSGEDFTVTTFNYFISNIALKKEDGTVLKFPNDYFLVRQADSKTLMATLKDVPAANYKEVTFTVGVDSTKSVSDVSQRTGVLDITAYADDNMYWSWNSGYIFMKMEGISSVVPLNSAGKRQYEYHIGGFGGKTAPAPNNIKTVTLSLTDLATVRNNIAPTIHLLVDAKKVFDGPTTIKLATTNMIHNPAVSAPIANNYKTMFSVDHVHNEKQ